MIEDIIKIEQEKLKQRGYDSVLSSESIKINRAFTAFDLVNNLYILDKVYSYNITDYGAMRVSIISPFNIIDETLYDMECMGNVVHKIFKHNLIVRARHASGYEFSTMSVNQGEVMNIDLPEFRLNFIKITPVFSIS